MYISIPQITSFQRYPKRAVRVRPKSFKTNPIIFQFCTFRKGDKSCDFVWKREPYNVTMGECGDFMHTVIYGPPGTGKTEVANRMADILFKLGYIRKGHLITVTRDDLVGQYIGHTAPKTKEVLKRAMGGVLFIDEAYYLYKPDNERDYGSEAIEILLQVMENQREDLVVIFAGYKDRMDSFYESNPGLSSRVANHIDFPDYTPEELIQIARLILQEQQYRMTPEAESALLEYVQKRSIMPLFANARTISNAIDTARMRHANRMFNSGDQVLTKSDLVTIQVDDIRESSLFSELR